MATLLYRLGRAAYRHPLRVFAAWGVLIALVAAALVGFGSRVDSTFTIPGSESQQALDELATSVPALAGSTAQVVFAAPEGSRVTDPPFAEAIARTLQQAAQDPQVAAAVPPEATGMVTADGRVGVASVAYTVDRASFADGTLDALEASAEPARAAGLQVEFGGTAYGGTGVHLSPLELVGVAVALVVLLVTFGSLLAAGMPLVTALVGIAVGVGGLLVASAVFTVSSTALSLALMLGLAVGIDYALFILSRHRGQLTQGMEPEESAARATGTAGSAVFFAGLTVVIALVGLTVVRIPFLTVMGLGAAATVLVAVAVALTLMPALLGLLGSRLAPRSGSRAASREAAAAAENGFSPNGTSPNGAAPTPAGGTRTGRGRHGRTRGGRARGGGERWARLVTRRPLVTAVVGVAALGVLAVPALDLRLGLPDNGYVSPDATERRAYDLISESFGPGYNGMLLVVVDTAGAPDPAQAVSRIGGQVRQLPGAVAAGLPLTSEDGRTTVLTVVPAGSPHSPETTRLVEEIRERASELEQSTGTEIAVTGATAIGIDVSDRLADSLLPFAAVVVGLALVLLMLVFRSVVVPLKATLGFLLSVAASLGVVVAVFQWGWLADVFGVHTTGPVVSFLPLMLLAVLFGLAMDYEVFLVSRMREEYVHRGDPRAAVVVGTRHGARVVTAAALIMFSVFASFVTTEDPMLKIIAFGLALGVFVDAFVVRMTIVPAVLALVGRGGWWLPRWLDRLLPNLDVEGERLPKLPNSASEAGEERICRNMTVQEPAMSINDSPGT